MTSTQFVVPGTADLQVKCTSMSALADVEASGSRKPYRRPAIVTREPMEVLAALCSPTSGGKAVPPLCNPIKS